MVAGLLCYVFWGLLPLIFQAASRAGAAPFEIVGWRTVASVPLAVLLVAATGRLRAMLALLRSPRDLSALLLSAALIGVNWATYVWAVSSGHVLAGSLGYYINPILNMAAGAWLFGERMDRTGWAAAALAAVGVVLQGVALGTFPWISIVLAVTFCGYGVVRKRAAADSQTGLLVECVLLSVPAALYLLWLQRSGGAHFGTTPQVDFWLLMTGPATVFPLFAFTFAARRLPLIAIGFLQFIAPTLLFVIGVHDGEGLSALRLASFAFIWSGVAVFVWGALAKARPARLRLQSEA